MRERHRSQAVTFHLMLLGVGDGLSTHDAGPAGATPQRRDTTSEEKATLGQPPLPDSLAKLFVCVTATADVSPLTAALCA
jgi:hypothetical protein